MDTKELALLTKNDIVIAEELVNDIKQYSENGKDILTAKQLSARVNNFFYATLADVELRKAQLNAQLKPLQTIEKNIKTYKAIMKRTIDNKRFEVQDAFREEAINNATKTIMDAESGNTIQIIDQAELMDDMKFMNSAFKKDRLLKKDIIIECDATNETWKKFILGDDEVDKWFLNVELDESAIKDKLIELTESLKGDYELAIKKMKLEEYGITIKVIK